MVRQNTRFDTDTLNTVCHTARMNQPAHRIRQSISRGTPSYQLGHYEMSGEQGKRRSAFKVDVHLGEYSTADEALKAWTEDIRQLRATRPRKADKLRAKLDKSRASFNGLSPQMTAYPARFCGMVSPP